MPPQLLEIGGVPVPLCALVDVVDDLHAIQGEPRGAGQLLDPLQAPEQDRPCDALIGHPSCGADETDVLGVGIDHLLRLLHGPGGDGVDQAVRGLEPGLKLGPVLVEVLDRSPGQAFVHGCLGHRGGHGPQHPGVERLGDQIVRPELELLQVICPEHRIGDRLPGQIGKGAGGGDLHLLRDRACPDVEGASEDEWESEDVVDLVRVVAAPRGNDHIVPRGPGVRVWNLRVGIGQSEDDGIGGHRLHHLLGDGARNRHSDQGVGSLEGIGQGPGVGLHGEFPLDVGEVVTLAVDDALGVGQEDVCRVDTELDEEPGRCDAGRSGPGEDHSGLGDVPLGQLQRVEKAGSPDDRRPVLVVVEHRDVEPIAECLLDVEALRGLDVLEIDAADRRGQHLAKSDHVVGVGGVDLEVENVDVGKALEQDRLPLHHRLSGEGTDVPQSQDRRAVGDHRHQIAAIRELECSLGIVGDHQARLGHTRGVGQAQVRLGGGRLGGSDRDLPRAGFRVVFECLGEVRLVGHGHRTLPAGRFRISPLAL